MDHIVKSGDCRENLHNASECVSLAQTKSIVIQKGVMSLEGHKILGCGVAKLRPRPRPQKLLTGRTSS